MDPADPDPQPVSIINAIRIIINFFIVHLPFELTIVHWILFFNKKAPTRPKPSEGTIKGKEPAILSSELFRQTERLRAEYPVHIRADDLLSRFDCRLCCTSVFTITCN